MLVILRVDRSLSTKTDEIPQYPAKIVKRSAAICSRIPTDEIAPAGMECSQSGPACYMPERKEVSGYRQEVARSILEPEGAMRLPPSSKEGSSFDSSFWASFGSIDISKSHDGKSNKAITGYLSGSRVLYSSTAVTLCVWSVG